MQEDPVGFESGANLYAYARGNPLRYVDPLGLDAILISFIDYMVDTERGFRLPLGHGAVIAVDPKTGKTNYYDYGRFYGHKEGIVRRMPVPNLVMVNGVPTAESLFNLYYHISIHYGHGSRVDAIYVQSAETNKVINFAERLMRDQGREPYALLSNNCNTFAKNAVSAGKK